MIEVHLKLAKNGEIAIESVTGKGVIYCSTLEKAKICCERNGWLISESSIGTAKEIKGGRTKLWKGK